MNILIVDDERLARVCLESLLSEILSGISLKFYHASNAIQATQLIEENPDINLSFVDYKMPNYNGYDFIVNTRKSYPNIEFVLVSGYNLECKSLYIDIPKVKYFISKPIDIGELANIIQKLCNV